MVPQGIFVEFLSNLTNTVIGWIEVTVNEHMLVNEHCVFRMTPHKIEFDERTYACENPDDVVNTLRSHFDEIAKKLNSCYKVDIFVDEIRDPYIENTQLYKNKTHTVEDI